MLSLAEQLGWLAMAKAGRDLSRGEGMVTRISINDLASHELRPA